MKPKRLTRQAKVVTFLIALLITVFSFDFVVPAKAEAPLLKTITVKPQVIVYLTQKDAPILVSFKEKKDQFTATELIQLLTNAGFKGQALKNAWAIAMRESHGNPLDHNTNLQSGDNSYGLFQINMIGSLGVNRLVQLNLHNYTDLFDPVTNVTAVYQMTDGGINWGSWGVGKNAYRNNEASYLFWLAQYPTD